MSLPEGRTPVSYIRKSMEIPKEVKSVLDKFKKQGYQAYAVGGCVRDFLRSVKPQDWDVTTNAKPEEIQKIFPKSFYANKFGTVTVQTKSQDPTLKEIEITTYRLEAKYTDKRHPDEVRWAETLKEDLARRDFTINAMALTQQPTIEIIDYFNGEDDLKNKIIRAVGKAEERFNEDALRMLRAVRLAVELGFKIEPKTLSAIQKNSFWLSAISKERIREELIRIILSENAANGINLLSETGLLKYIIPELEKGIGISQNRHHIYTIYQHSILSLKYASQRKYNLIVCLAALFHDIAKPQAKRGEGPDATFYNHDILGARIAIRILERLRFPRQIIEKVANLIRNHMFVYDIGKVTEAGVRRLLLRVGPENINDLIALRVADRLGSGVPKAQPYRLRHFQYMAEKVQHDAISVKMLKINGHEIMKILGIKPGPKIGAILDVLLAEVIEKPEKNEKEYLKGRIKELDKLDLLELRKMAKQKIEEKKEEEDLLIKGKYWVK